jgi:hypothetical protein
MIGETIQEQIKHGYKPNSREVALVTLTKQVRKTNLEK